MARPTPTQREGWGLEGIRRGREKEKPREDEFIIVDGGEKEGEWGDWGENWNEGGKEWGKEWEGKGEGGNQWREMVLLVVLYTVQGLPLGLTFGSIPLLLRSSSRFFFFFFFFFLFIVFCLLFLVFCFVFCFVDLVSSKSKVMQKLVFFLLLDTHIV